MGMVSNQDSQLFSKYYLPNTTNFSLTNQHKTILSPASEFPWTYDSSESCYLLAGQVTVTPSDGRKAATFGKGDYVTFPAGMSCTWDVSEAVEKHFMFF